MTSKNNSFWNHFSTWHEAEQAWDNKKQQSAQAYPIRSLNSFPSKVEIDKKTNKQMWLKGLLWLIKQDKNFVLMRRVARRPILHTFRYIHSLLSKNIFIRDGNLYLYGVKKEAEYRTALQDTNTLFILGFAYCHKPFECPEKRFSSNCIASFEHPVCCQCFIGKCINTLPSEKTIVSIVPTVNAIGEKIFELQDAYPTKQLLFLITACEMMLKMFGSWADMIGIKGIGVRLSGRVCNTFDAFKLSERGIKPQLTTVDIETQNQVLSLLKLWRSIHFSNVSEHIPE